MTALGGRAGRVDLDARVQVFGAGGEPGRIEPGYSADLVLWSGDPLEVTTVADQV